MTDYPPLHTEILDPLVLEPNRDELLRYLGYRGEAAKQRTVPPEIEREVARGQLVLRPRGIYSVYPVDEVSERQLTIGGVTIHGQVASFLAGADRVVVFIVTVGQGITDCSRAASTAGDVVAAWALDALGSYAAEAAALAISQQLRQRNPASEAVSSRYSPGYCGMRLTEQRALFGLIDAEAIGVTLHSSMLMQPTKSVSGLLGVGAMSMESSPCERCNDQTCSKRR